MKIAVAGRGEPGRPQILFGGEPGADRALARVGRRPVKRNGRSRWPPGAGGSRPPVIWRKVWIANGAVPSEAGRRSARTGIVCPGATGSPGSAQCARRICSVAVSRRASADSGQWILRLALQRVEKLPAPGLQGSAGTADRFFALAERLRAVGHPEGIVRQRSGPRIEGEPVVVADVLDSRWAFEHFQTEVQGVAAEDVPTEAPAPGPGWCLPPRRSPAARRALSPAKTRSRSGRRPPGSSGPRAPARRSPA